MFTDQIEELAYAANTSLAAEYRKYSLLGLTLRKLEQLPKYRDHLAEAKTRRQLHLLGMLIVFAVSGAFFAVTYMVWRNWYPMPATKYWFAPASWSSVAGSAWPMILWGTGVTAIVKFATKNEAGYNRFAGEIVGHNMVTSAQAGLLEELNYRWIRFYIAIPLLTFGNWLLFGWGGRTGWVRSLNEDTLLPLADWATLHKLHEYLTVVDGMWLVPAAVLYANASFRDGHKVNRELLKDKPFLTRLAINAFPMLNSWYCGMVLFYIMFHYGLFAAIVVHAVYDMLIHGVEYIDAKLERS